MLPCPCECHAPGVWAKRKPLQVQHLPQAAACAWHTVTCTCSAYPKVPASHPKNTAMKGACMACTCPATARQAGILTILPSAGAFNCKHCRGTSRLPAACSHEMHASPICCRHTASGGQFCLDHMPNSLGTRVLHELAPLRNDACITHYTASLICQPSHAQQLPQHTALLQHLWVGIACILVQLVEDSTEV